MAEFEFSAFIENLSSRTCGIISGVWLHFPTTKQLVHEALRFIGVDGLRNEETIFTDYRIAIPELRSVMVEYAHVDELNYLANRIKAMSPEERRVFRQLAGCYQPDLQSGLLRLAPGHHFL